MLKKILIGFVALLAAGIMFAAAGLAWAHAAIRRERAPLPSRTEVTLAAALFPDLPVRLSIINTASQPMPRAAVLDPAHDPQPQDPYVMSHPSFVLEWEDGRILLIDVGMTRLEALDFGRPLQWLAGAAPIQPLTSTAEALGAARRRVQGIVFTHLHSDHVGGLVDLCDGLDHPVRVFMTAAQAERPNYTTRPGLTLLRRSPCVRMETLTARGSLFPVPGFGGVFVISAGGHTPGSQIVVVVVRAPDGGHGYVLTGDIVNNIDGVTYNIPKPRLYSLLMVPEDRERLDEVRRYLKDLHDRNRFPLLVSHDQLALAHSGVAPWVMP